MTNPTVWGPHGWFFIETIVLSIPKDVKDTSPYITFLQSLKDVLPCSSCRKEYTEYIATHPIPTGREDIIMWVFTLHNAVRTRTGKTPRSIESMIKYYDPKPSSSVMWWVSVVIVLAAVGYAVLKK
jgi:hypothetical protein